MPSAIFGLATAFILSIIRLAIVRTLSPPCLKLWSTANGKTGCSDITHHCNSWLIQRSNGHRRPCPDQARASAGAAVQWFLLVMPPMSCLHIWHKGRAKACRMRRVLCSHSRNMPISQVPLRLCPPSIRGSSKNYPESRHIWKDYGLFWACRKTAKCRS